MRSIRQHVNPLGLAYMRARAQPIPIPVALKNDVQVELGCADGDFSFELAQARAQSFVVGLEIREALVAKNNEKAAREGLENLCFGYVNLNVDLDRVFQHRSVHLFHLLFPDPWFKSKHRKRRVLDVELCRVMAQQLVPGGELHFASDIFEVALAALEVMESQEIHEMGWLNLAGSWSFSRQAPVAAKSRRERTTESRNQRVWRLRFRYLPPGRSTATP